MKKIRHESSQALKHVLGKRLKYVMAILILISWLGDSLLNVVQDFLGETIPLTSNFSIKSDLAIFFIATFFLLLVIYFARKSPPSDNFVAKANDNKVNSREVLLVNLSRYTPYGKLKQGKLDFADKGYSLELFKNNLSNFPNDKPLKEIAGTNFQCNWLPLLRAIEHYPNIKEVIVFTTLSTPDNEGSHKNVDVFRDLVNKYFSLRHREIVFKTYLSRDVMTSDHFKAAYPEGLPTNNIHEFAQVVLHVLDNIDARYDKSIDSGDKIAIDVTGGMSSMSAVLAAVSVSKGTFMHYTDTNTFESQELDITAQ